MSFKNKVTAYFSLEIVLWHFYKFFVMAVVRKFWDVNKMLKDFEMFKFPIVISIEFYFLEQLFNYLANSIWYLSIDYYWIKCDSLICEYIFNKTYVVHTILVQNFVIRNVILLIYFFFTCGFKRLKIVRFVGIWIHPIFRAFHIFLIWQ